MIFDKNLLDAAILNYNAKAEDELEIDGPVNVNSITKLEDQLRYPLHEDLKNFLASYGAISIGDDFFNSIDDDPKYPIETWDLLNSTKELKNQMKDFKNGFLCIRNESISYFWVFDNNSGDVFEYDNISKLIVRRGFRLMDYLLNFINGSLEAELNEEN